MGLLRRKFIFGGFVMLSLQLSLALTAQAQSDEQAKISKNAGRAICHFTGDVRTPFELVVVRGDSASGHAGHDGDVKAENGACPSLVPANWSGTLRSGQSVRSGTAGSSVEASPLIGSAGKNVEIKPADTEKNIAICHKEGDGSYHLNSVAENAVNTHLGHGDIYPENGGCLAGSTGGEGDVGATPEPVTMLLFGAGLAGIGYVSRRRMANRKPV